MIEYYGLLMGSNFFNSINDLVIKLHFDDNYVYILLVGVILMDIITGNLKAIKWKVQDSSAGSKGLIKHGIVLLMFTLIFPFSVLFEVELIAKMFCILYIYNYIVSILENFGVMGIYTPGFLKIKVEEEIKKYEDKLSNLLNKEIENND